MDQESYQLDVENSFIYFLITLQKLHLSQRVLELMLLSNVTVKNFLPRNRKYLRKPRAVLVL